MTIETITAKIRAFRDARDWMQFHHPKEMAMAISIEAAELLEHFLWKSREECLVHLENRREAIQDEVADIAIYLFEFADNHGIDLLSAMETKLAKNAVNYPVEKARGSHLKYTELSSDDENA